jgi:hypothetical protein
MTACIGRMYEVGMLVIQNGCMWSELRDLHDWLDECVPSWYYEPVLAKMDSDRFRNLMTDMMERYSQSSIVPVLHFVVPTQNDAMLMKLAWPVRAIEPLEDFRRKEAQDMEAQDMES